MAPFRALTTAHVVYMVHAMSMLFTTNQVIEALGGYHALVTLTGRSLSAVYHWREEAASRSRGTFPAELFLLMNTELVALGHTAHPGLWRQVAKGGERWALDDQQEAA